MDRDEAQGVRSFPAVLGPDGQQIETFGRIQKTHVSSDTAEGYQKGDFPERDCTDEPKRSGSSA